MQATVTLRSLNAGSPDLELVKQLNDEAFPPEEHIEIDDALAIMQNGNSELLGIYAGQRFVGFFLIRLWPACAYIGYFAIAETERGQGHGSAALTALRAYYADRQIVVDFEALDDAAPNAAQRARRRAFYLRSGFRPTGYYMFYMQTEFEVTWMGNQPQFNKAAFEELLADVRAQVPDFHPQMYKK